MVNADESAARLPGTILTSTCSFSDRQLMIREGAREDAKKSWVMRILIRAVVAKEGIEATEAELEKELLRFAGAAWTVYRSG